MTMRAGLYARISEIDERVAKVANQITDCRSHADTRGYLVTHEYVDDGISATGGKPRPGFEELLRDVEAGRLDVIVAVDEDRLSRALEDTLRLQVVSAASGVVWDTVRGGVADPAKAQGEAFSVIRAVMSRLEVRQKVDRQKAANHHRRMSGQPLTGTRPFGFEVDRIRHRPDEAKEIAWAYAEIIANGGKLYPILKSWNERGVLTSRGNKWSYATLQQLLRRASNAGLVEHERVVLEDVKATWEPIVAREDWQRVVRLLSDSRRRITKQREPVHLLPGLARCGVCDSVMRSSGSTNVPGEKIYRCATKINAQSDGRRHVSIRVAEADRAVVDALTMYLGDVLHRRRVQRARSVNREAIEAALGETVRLTNQLTEVGTDYDDGIVTRSEWLQRRDRLQAKLEVANKLLVKMEAEEGPMWPEMPDWARAGILHMDERSQHAVRDGFDRAGFVAWWSTAALTDRRSIIEREVESIAIARATDPHRIILTFRDGRVIRTNP